MRSNNLKKRRGESKREETRARLLETAIKILAEKGIEATSVLEITQAAQVSNGTFYYHFRDKDALLAEVARVLVSDIIDRLHIVLDNIDSPEEKVALGIQWLLEKASENPELGLIIAESMQVDGVFTQRISARIQEDVQRGIARKQFFVTPSRLLFQMLGAVNVPALRQRILDPQAGDVGLFTAQIHLRMLGVDVNKARILAEEAKERLPSIMT